MKPDVVSVIPLATSLAAAAEALFTVHRARPDLTDLPPASAAAMRGLLTGATTVLTATAMARLPLLEIVAVNGVGYDGVDLAYTRAHGIVVTNTPDVLTSDVADLAVGLLIALVRDIPGNDRFVREGQWRTAHPRFATRRLCDLRLGIFGLGRIGLAIAERCRPMVASIAYHNRRPRADVAFRYYDTLQGLAGSVDVLVIAAPGSADTVGVVNAAVLGALGGGLLVNIARGSLVDEAALVEALVGGALGGAALDVFAHEPMVPEALLGLGNVILQPHVGSATQGTRQAMGALALENLAAYFAGRPVPTPV